MEGLKIDSIAKIICDYVIEHNNEVKMREVIEYILETKKINTTESYIRSTLNVILIKHGGTLIPESLTGKIEDYVIKHDYKVSNEEVIKYIFEETEIKTTKSSIIATLNRVLNKLGGTLITAGIREEIKAYVEEHKNKVVEKEVIEYILKKKKIQVTKEHIKKVLREVLGELGGTLKESTLKSSSFKEKLREYVIKNGKYVSFEEVKNFALENGVDRLDESLRGTLRNVLKEAGGTLKPAKKKSYKNNCKKEC